MRWTPLPRGAFTHIDWSRPGATAGFDPYLVWAEADNFAGYKHPKNKPPRRLPLLLELKDGCTILQLKQASDPSWLAIAPVYWSADAPQGLRYCTVRVGQRFFREIRPGGRLHALVDRFELGLPAQSHSEDPPEQAAPGKMHRSIAPAKKLSGKVLALIDGGLAFANADFLTAGKARTRYFWRQDEQGVGVIPPQMGYGHELTSVEIDTVMNANRYGGMVDESAVYAHFDLPDLRRSVNHGTHVMGLAAGPQTVTAKLAGVPPHLNAPPTWALAEDDASRCDLVAVQLDWNTVLDTSGGSMNVHVMDGLMYILSRCTPSARIAVNISWGTLAGPHDGSSVLEAAMDQLVALRRGALEIVLPAGNSYQSRTHANQQLDPGQSETLSWCVQPDDYTQSFLEIWLAPATDAPLGPVSIRITPPGGDALPWMPLGGSGMWTGETDQPLCALIFPSSVATGTTGTCALLALQPTASFEQGVTTALSGTWGVEIRNDARRAVIFDAYIERDDVPIGVTDPGGRQSYFTDALYDTSGNPGSFVDHAANPTPIRRSGNFNSISTGHATTAVGGLRVSTDSWALYSPQRPDPVPSRPRRPGVVDVPAAEAFSDETPALWGVCSSGTRSGGVVRLVGTSSSTPQITRKTLNRM